MDSIGLELDKAKEKREIPIPLEFQRANAFGVIPLRSAADIKGLLMWKKGLGKSRGKREGRKKEVG